MTRQNGKRRDWPVCPCPFSRGPITSQEATTQARTTVSSVAPSLPPKARPAVPRSGEAGTFRNTQSWPVLFLETRSWHCKSRRGVAIADSWQESCRGHTNQGEEKPKRNSPCCGASPAASSLLLLLALPSARDFPKQYSDNSGGARHAPRTTGLPGRHRSNGESRDVFRLV